MGLPDSSDLLGLALKYSANLRDKALTLQVVQNGTPVSERIIMKNLKNGILTARLNIRLEYGQRLILRLRNASEEFESALGEKDISGVEIGAVVEQVEDSSIASDTPSFETKMLVSESFRVLKGTKNPE